MYRFSFQYRTVVYQFAIAGLVVAYSNSTAFGAELDTRVPSEKSEVHNVPLNIDIPSQSLGSALNQLGKVSNINIAYPTDLTRGKISQAIKGKMSAKQALQKLLENSGLEPDYQGDTVYIKPLQRKAEINVDLKEIKVRAKRFKEVGPLPGLALTKEQVPGNIQSISAKEIKEAHALSLTDLMNSKLQSVNVNDYQGNPFQMDVTYRGFTASPQLGTPQGLSVFFDGIRVNEPFGDVVNWDMIPTNALEGMDVYPGSNPLFGLNTLGGALAVKTKSGFTTEGFSAEILSGSFGRKQLQVSGGVNNGDFAAFGAGNFFMEDGWRDNSPSKVNQAFGKLEWQGERASLAFSSLAAVNKLVGNGTVPIELYQQDPKAVFTSPDETRNKLLQFQLSGAFDVTDTFSITGMVYKRGSNRVSTTGDIIDVDTFRDAFRATREPTPGKTYTCAFTDANADGVPDYYLDALDTNNPSPFYADFIANGGNVANFALAGALNPNIPAADLARFIDIFKNSDNSIMDNSASPGISASQDFSFDNNGTQTFLIFKPPANLADCTDPVDYIAQDNGVAILPVLLPDGSPSGARRDGATMYNGIGTGVVAGTPTAVITNSNIEQETQGGAVQLNWNTQYHKFMMGASVDASSASYLGKQRYGQIDDNRNVFNDPSQLGKEFYAADHDVTINDFDGKLKTQSAYFSETWTPTETLNFAFSARYNYTNVQNNLAPQKVNGVGSDIAKLLNQYDFATICPGTDLSNCPINLSAPVPLEVRLARTNKTLSSLDKKITEKFTYHSLNPAVGVTWQATPQLNLYASWNQGTRVPSVIELGCAYDGTIVPYGRDEFGNFVDIEELRKRYPGDPSVRVLGSKPRSLLDGRGCNLPSSLSGDPYLPQVVAQTTEFGARGKFKDLLEWNISAYQTNLKDDLYLVSPTPTLSFFQDVGATRRRGIEFGLSGEHGKSDFRVNYSLTEATFQSDFRMLSLNNSSFLSNVTSNPLYGQIGVKPGDRMPGVPLHNVNLTWGYKVTPALKVGLTMVGHSDAFVRGNENNEHTAGPGRGIVTTGLDATGQTAQITIPTADFKRNGKSDGYAVLNFKASYDFNKSWKAGLIVNNILDKQYFSAGRLGLTPFSPSVNGAIGPGGFNYNSSEWTSTQFMSAGAPRGLWATLSYEFDASKKALPPNNISMTEPDTLPPEAPPPSAQELELQKNMAKISTLPVLKLTKVQAINTAKSEVAAAIESWKLALMESNSEKLLQHYARTFSPEGISHDAWQDKQKIDMLTEPNSVIMIKDLFVTPQGRRMAAVFQQTVRSANVEQESKKILYFEQQNGRWVIVGEYAAKVRQAKLLDGEHLPKNQKNSALKVKHEQASLVAENK
jgi:outer membrane receptor protein involved in Fe transport